MIIYWVGEDRGSIKMHEFEVIKDTEDCYICDLVGIGGIIEISKSKASMTKLEAARKYLNYRDRVSSKARAGEKRKNDLLEAALKLFLKEGGSLRERNRGN
jgi:hypothetical protein